jgi:hypothetical protein
MSMINVLSLQPMILAMLYLMNKGDMATVRDHWWVAGAAAVVCAALYAVSLYCTGRMLVARRERLIGTVASTHW